MTQDEIIDEDFVLKMARQVGICKDEMDTHWAAHGYELVAFTKLVAEEVLEKERELLNTVFWAFQEWKEDHMSQTSFIQTMQYLRARSQE